MTGHMFGRLRLLPFVVAAILLDGAAGAVYAQTIGPDEAVTPQGTVTQKLALTEAQKSAIYNAVLGQRVRSATSAIWPVVGAPVPHAIALSDIPVQTLFDQDSLDDSRGNLLKYAIVEGEVVVIDPIQMRVVDVIHRGAISGAVP
jgi:hypothetical protein